MKVKIHVCGCDDTTTFEMEVTVEQYEFLTTLMEECDKASEYECQPIIKLTVENS